jgi:outer membrane protein assembly factor BamD (BamD/ComL family)
MADQQIKDLIRARSRVQASLTRIQTFVQQYDESQDVLNIKLRMRRLGEIWNKHEYRIDWKA